MDTPEGIAIPQVINTDERRTVIRDEEYGYITMVVGGTPNQSDYNFARECAKQGINVVFVHGNPKPPCPTGGCQ